MLKTSAVAAVVSMLILPSCALACEGNSVKEFLEGKCDKLKGFDSLCDIKGQSKEPKSSIPAFYEFSPIHRIDRGLQTPSGSHGWRVYGDNSNAGTGPFFPMKRAPRIFGPDGEFSKQSVDEFMTGRTDELRGVDAIPTNMKAPLPPAWGGDEFVKTEGFTQSGAPYQQVNPLFGVKAPKLENGEFKFEKWKLPQE